MRSLLKIEKLLILLIALFGCDKEELLGDKSLLIGSYNWEYTARYHVGDYTSYYDTIFTSAIGSNYLCKFEEKGLLRTYKDGVQLEKIRLHFSSFNASSTTLNAYDFSIAFKEEQIMGTVFQNALVFYTYFPYDRVTGADNIYVTNYFVRE